MVKDRQAKYVDLKENKNKINLNDNFLTVIWHDSWSHNLLNLSLWVTNLYLE